MDLLIEFGEVRRAVHVEKEAILSSVEKEVRKFEPTAIVSLTLDSKESCDVFLLQRYSDYWKCYVNVSSIDEVAQGDKLTVTRPPSTMNSKAAVSIHVESIHCVCDIL